MKKIILLFTFSFLLLLANAQETFNQKFLEANTLMEENQYNVALPIWLELQLEQPDNFNLNYKVGVCYIHSTNNKSKALSFLVKAVQNTSKNYDPFSTSEKKSPIKAYFYLARAYHINYELDAALLNYNSFKEKVSKKHYLFKEADHHMEQCRNAKEEMKNPKNVEIKNLGRTINSSEADYSPVLSIDESTLFFTSRRVRKDSSNYYIKDINDGQHYEDIYVSNNYDGQWEEPTLLSLNTEDHEATLNISADGQTLFIFKDDDIYISKFEDDEWGYPIKLADNINLVESRETHAHISPEGDILYFVSNRKGGKGGSDIYKSKKLPNGEWADPQNMGDIINTEYDEEGIFVHPDGKSIYFSSKGHKSIGGYDIFYSEMDDAGNWSIPKNMGYPINSTDDDVFFVTSADGKRGYYSSFQEKGYGEKDIYMISLEDADAKPVTLLTGIMKVVGKTELPSDAQVVVTDNETGNLVGIYRPRKKDGKFRIILTPGNDYHIVYSAAGFTQEEDLYIPPISAYQEINRGIDLDDVVFGGNGEIIKDDEEPKPDLNYKDGDEIEKLKAELNRLQAIIESDKTNVSALNAELERLKSELYRLENQKGNDDSSLPNNNNNNTKPTPAVIGNVLAYYQEFFNYNVKDINVNASKYTDMVAKAVAKAKKEGKVVIDIESSASKVPTKTYGSNASLAFKRAMDAEKTIVKSLVAKGVSEDQIVINDVSSGVKGPQYNDDAGNTATYEQYQYIIIKIR